MPELSLLFSEQCKCYDNISVSLDRLKEGTKLKALKTRKTFILGKIKAFVEKLKEVSIRPPCLPNTFPPRSVDQHALTRFCLQLKVVAEEFTSSVMNQVNLSSISLSRPQSS